MTCVSYLHEVARQCRVQCHEEFSGHAKWLKLNIDKLKSGLMQAGTKENASSPVKKMENNITISAEHNVESVLASVASPLNAKKGELWAKKEFEERMQREKQRKQMRSISCEPISTPITPQKSTQKPPLMHAVSEQKPTKTFAQTTKFTSIYLDAEKLNKIYGSSSQISSSFLPLNSGISNSSQTSQINKTPTLHTFPKEFKKPQTQFTQPKGPDKINALTNIKNPKIKIENIFSTNSENSNPFINNSSENSIEEISEHSSEDISEKSGDGQNDDGHPCCTNDTSDDGDDHNDTSERQYFYSNGKRRKIPDWALGEGLKDALKKQYGPATIIDPDLIFGEVETCDLQEVFNRFSMRYANRTSSQNWKQDQLTIVEKRQYKKKMGYK